MAYGKDKLLANETKLVILVTPNLRTADIFLVVASVPLENNVVIFRRERSDDQKYVCCSQASRPPVVVTLSSISLIPYT